MHSAHGNSKQPATVVNAVGAVSPQYSHQDSPNDPTRTASAVRVALPRAVDQDGPKASASQTPTTEAFALTTQSNPNNEVNQYDGEKHQTKKYGKAVASTEEGDQETGTGGGSAGASSRLERTDTGVANREVPPAGRGGLAQSNSASSYSDLIENRCRWACRIASVTFVGLQSGFGKTPDVCLFKSPRGSTLSVPIYKAYPFYIAWRVIESEREFAQGKKRCSS